MPYANDIAPSARNRLTTYFIPSLSSPSSFILKPKIFRFESVMMKRLIFVLFFFWVSAGSLWALGTPDLRCLQVKSDGSVLLTWIAPSDMTGFQRYEIFYSYDNITFSLAGIETSPTANSYLHLINAHTQPTIYYYVEAVPASGNRPKSRTLNTLEFYLSNSGLGEAQLKWSPPITPLLSSYEAHYTVEVKRYFDSDFSTRTTVSNQKTAYLDVIDHICNGWVDYRIALADTEAGCINVSRTLGDVFEDMTSPEMPVLDSVSVDFATGLTHLGWMPSSSTDVFAYVIYFYNAGQGWSPLDTLYGYHTTAWIDRVNPAGKGSGQYRIAALDSCMNSSTMTVFQQTMLISGVLDDCNNTMALRWNDYQNMKGGVGSYKLYYSLNGAPLQLAATTSVPQYTFPNVLLESNYIFVVQAINGNGTITASSKSFAFYSGDIASEYLLYFRYASVVDNRNIELKIFTNGDTLPFSKLRIYRSLSRDKNFSLLTEISSNGGTDYQFTDADAEVAHTVYYYYAEILNTCNNPSKVSNTVQNFLLKGENFSDRTNHIKWATPEGWEIGVDHFVIERKRQIELYFNDIDIQYPVPANEYNDNVENLFDAGSDFFYKVTAVEQPNSFGFQDSSTSNTIVLKQLPVTYIANAFRPEGMTNNLFKPANSFVSTENYLFVIYSRAGQMMFQTRNPYEGWDGNMNGIPVPSGVYTYRLHYLLPDGTPYERVGSVTLVR